MNDESDAIDWTMTTWEGSRRAQLRRALAMSLRERLEAMVGLADVGRRLQEMRAEGRFKNASEVPKKEQASEYAAGRERGLGRTS